MSPQTKTKNESLIQQLCRIPSFAHHPTCSCFDHHLLRFGTIAVCLGCTCLSAGLLIGSATLLALASINAELMPRIGWFWTVLAGTVCYLPTLLQPRLQNKPFKMFARTALGIAIVFLWFGAMVLLPATTQGLMLRLAFLVVFLGVAVLTLQLRTKCTPVAWRQCPSGGFPFCVENLKRMKNAINDSNEREGTDNMLAMLLAESVGYSSSSIVRFEISVAGDMQTNETQPGQVVPVSNQ